MKKNSLNCNWEQSGQPSLNFRYLILSKYAQNLQHYSHFPLIASAPTLINHNKKNDDDNQQQGMVMTTNNKNNDDYNDDDDEDDREESNWSSTICHTIM